MLKPRWLHVLRLASLLILLLAFSGCSKTFQGDEYSFLAPSGFKTKQFEEVEANPNNEPALLIFSQKGRLYFQVFRQKIPPEGDLKLVFAEHRAQTSGKTTNYQFISQNTIEMYDQPAIEYVYREFHGEPYVQKREIWLEKSGWAYSLVCTNPADSTPGIEIPIPDLCIRLAEGFRFK
ncbi:MAG: hypothetical protein HPY59_18475 [Anaerolineae bacterium]|nr:hypothetical protein [Anaerolineae bacterium]